jgi:beta-N-acetylhexosaminidase
LTFLMGPFYGGQSIVFHAMSKTTKALISFAVMIAGCTTPPRASSPASTPRQPGPISPGTPLTSSQREWVEKTLSSLTLRERVGQMVMEWVLGDYTNAKDSSYAEVTRWIEQDHLGGVSMSLGTPIEVAAKINDMQRHSKVPLLVSADLEPGLGRLEGGLFAHYMLDAGSATVFPTPMAIAATGRDSDAYDVARAIAREGRAVGIHINFSPVVDVNNNPANPVINTRSYGEDPARVARLSALFVRGAQDGGQLATAKHFPGHGDTDVDSHVGLPLVRVSMARLDSVELVPFKAAVAAGASLVMTAHIALPAVTGDSTTPATLSPRVITNLLRDSVGFRGVAITDAMTMEGIGKGYTTEQSSVLAVKAGADILLKPSDPTRAINALVAAVEKGEIARARIDSSVRHILELKVRAGAVAAPIASLEYVREVVGSPEHRALSRDIAKRAMTLLRDRDNLVPLRGDPGSMLLVEYAPETEIKIGRACLPQMRGLRGKGSRGASVVRITPGTNARQLDSISRVAATASTIIVAAYVRRVEGEGRVAVPNQIASWVDSLSRRRPTVVVSLGNPYLIRQFPSVGTYLNTYGVGESLECAAGVAIFGGSPITGRSPVSLPGFFKAGDGIQR